MNIDRYRRRVIASAVLITILGFGISASAQRNTARSEEKGAATPAPAEQSAEEKTQKVKRAWSLKMSTESPHTFTLKAKDANLREITNELSRLVKVPVFMSPLLDKQSVSFDFSGINLEGTVRLLAPQTYIDYEIGGDDQVQPKALAIYLQAFNEKPPSTSQVVKGNSEAILIEGDTEDGVGDEETQKKREEENPLKVSFARNAISIRARKQPLSVVLFKVASELGIPFEMRYESTEVVDVDFNNYSVDLALRSLSPTVRLFYRTDLQSYETQPLRIVLAAPVRAKS